MKTQDILVCFVSFIAKCFLFLWICSQDRAQYSYTRIKSPSDLVPFSSRAVKIYKAVKTQDIIIEKIGKFTCMTAGCETETNTTGWISDHKSKVSEFQTKAKKVDDDDDDDVDHSSVKYCKEQNQ